MSNWATDLDTNVRFDDGVPEAYSDKNEEDAYDEDNYGDDEENYDDDEAYLQEQWDNAEVVRVLEADDEGRRFEVIKKVRRYHVDRYITPADLRARFTHFGKGLTDQKHLVSKEPPLALEMGTADEYERKSRDEVKRFINEMASSAVKVSDPRFANVEKEERARIQRREGEEAASSPASGSGTGTWGASRGIAKKAAAEEDPDVARRVRVTNLSDNITEENLRTIFSAGGAEIDRVFLPTDKTTGKVLGYAFLTFRDKRMAEDALRKKSIRFKNVVLQVCKAVAKTK